MPENTRNSFDPEFRLDVAKLIVEQKYSIREAAQAMNAGKSTMDNGCANSSRN
jgi:transposase